MRLFAPLLLVLPACSVLYQEDGWTGGASTDPPSGDQPAAPEGDASSSPTPDAPDAQVACEIMVGRVCVDKYETTGADYARFLDDVAQGKHTPNAGSACSAKTSYTPRGGWPTSGPVGHVDWCDGQAFCAWAGKRLCKDAEWTKGCAQNMVGALSGVREWMDDCELHRCDVAGKGGRGSSCEANEELDRLAAAPDTGIRCCKDLP
jgi:hypothetical protein